MSRRHSLLVSLLVPFVVLLALTGGAHAASASTGIQGAVGCSTLITFSYGGLGEGLEAWSGAAAAQNPQVLLWQLTPAALAAAKYGPGLGKAIYAQRDRAWKAALVSGRVLVTVGSSVVTDARMCVTGYGAGNAYGRGIACAMTAANFVPVGGTAFRSFRALAVLKGAPKGLRAISAPKAAIEAAAGAAKGEGALSRIGSRLADESGHFAPFAGRGGSRLTNSQATDLADWLGFRRTGQRLRGQLIFRDGNRYIVQDIDAHSGGVWKMADSLRALGSKSTRMGTYDEQLNKIGP